MEFRLKDGESFNVQGGTGLMVNGQGVIAQLSYSLVKANIENGGVKLQDRTSTEVTVDDSVSSLTFTLPEKIVGKSRDFFLRLIVTGETIPTLSFVEPNGDSVSFDVDDDSWAEIEQGVNILMFTDTGE